MSASVYVLPSLKAKDMWNDANDVKAYVPGPGSLESVTVPEPTRSSGLKTPSWVPSNENEKVTSAGQVAAEPSESRAARPRTPMGRRIDRSSIGRADRPARTRAVGPAQTPGPFAPRIRPMVPT